MRDRGRGLGTAALYVLDDRAARGLSPEGWANGWRRPRRGGTRPWWWPRPTRAGRWSRACSGRGLRAAGAAGPCVEGQERAGGADGAEVRDGQGNVAGEFPELEAELGGMIAGGGYEGRASPDRADAMVWAMTVLSETRSGVPRSTAG